MIRFADAESLNGLWAFHFEEKELSDREILAAAMDEFQTVPGCFDAAPPRFGRQGTGIYRRSFHGGGRVMIRVRGVTLRGKVFVDGQKLGEIPYAFTPCDFVTGVLAEGEHTLTIAATNCIDESNASMFHEFYDFYSFGGICRPVEVRRLGENSIAAFSVIPLETETGRVRVTLSLEKAAKLPWRLKIDGVETKVPPFAGETVQFETEIAGLSPWSPESPVLHTAEAILPFDRARTTFGMRVLRWDDGVLRLNGKPLKLYGFCRHDSHPEFGYAVPEARVLADLRMLKESGCNFLRGAHYKQSDFLLDCCDRLGILVWEESCGWGNSAEQCADPTFRKRQVEQTRRMVGESINHPSVILWGFMNESRSDTEETRGLLTLLFDAVRSLDASRPVTYASNLPDQDICFDLADVLAVNLYPGWYPCEKNDRIRRNDIDRVQPVLEHVKARFSAPDFRHKPWIISEIGAAALVGNHNGARWSEDYQAELVEKVLDFVSSDSRCTGVALWIFADVNTYLGTSGIMNRPNGMNNKGLLTGHRHPKLAWHVLCRFLKSLG
ncbi:MAG: hypothetical protein MR051_09070 [Lentisphaeria bacterium]|nr:hypothetical protein [Lentisphaeria bacterium]